MLLLFGLTLRTELQESLILTVSVPDWLVNSSPDLLHRGSVYATLSSHCKDYFASLSSLASSLQHPVNPALLLG